jgi:hypothetical protein
MGEHRKVMNQLFAKAKKKAKIILKIKNDAQDLAEKNQRIKESQIPRTVSNLSSALDLTQSNNVESLFQSMGRSIKDLARQLREMESANLASPTLFTLKSNTLKFSDSICEASEDDEKTPFAKNFHKNLNQFQQVIENDCKP